MDVFTIIIGFIFLCSVVLLVISSIITSYISGKDWSNEITADIISLDNNKNANIRIATGLQQIMDNIYNYKNFNIFIIINSIICIGLIIIYIVVKYIKNEEKT